MKRRCTSVIILPSGDLVECTAPCGPRGHTVHDATVKVSGPGLNHEYAWIRWRTKNPMGTRVES